MVDRKLKRWVEQQLDKGESREVIQKALENKGYDPSIVDEVEEEEVSSSISINSEDKIRKISLGVEKGIEGASEIRVKQVIILSTILTALFLGLYFQPFATDKKTSEEPATVTLGKVSANPATATINRTDAVKFRNNASHSFKVSFDRNISSFSIQPGSSVVRNFNRTTYYDADPLDDGRTIKGSIYTP
ncbi:hypothetical protein [Candidatus Nanohalobium constans]|uniref:Uncharacterized protein n=1 Tax=Candidatus Nanohalobium constans TaxID=2565781 RepID=A0A5Q0UGI0_9ARCH|nr:hypothetical protein [Candidatus Nanohalobium constans]QGA80320.1 hypothetical protein LC1Nh_0419 [Candidatus Nanohalobium constans]